MMVLMDDEFVYSALPAGCVRLLNVKTSPDGEVRLSLRMQDYVLEDAPSFYALSYTWGTSLKTEIVLCNNKPLKIRRNLADALYAVFGPDHNLCGPLWVDAICINQVDDNEKAVQVRRMGDIYRRARSVVIWLGPAADHSDAAMDLLPDLAEVLPQIATSTHIHTLGPYGLPEYNDLVWIAVGDLFKRPWFNRLWTFQEAALSRKAIVVCGDRSASWDILAAGAWDINRLGLSSRCLRSRALLLDKDYFYIATIIDNIREGVQGGHTLDFSNLLRIANQKTFSQTCDKVYAILSLAHESVRQRIPITYTNADRESLTQLWIACARACIESGQYDILRLVDSREHVSGLPSWCPDLRVQLHIIPSLGSSFRAGISETAQASVKLHPSLNILSARGFRIDTMSEMIDYTMNPGTTHLIGNPSDFLTWERQCLALAKKTYPSTNDNIPAAHLFIITNNTNSPVPEDTLRLAYDDVLRNVTRLSQLHDSDITPAERIKPYYDTWHSMLTSCSGRCYFSTSKGHVGVASPGIKRGDTVVVIYGAKPIHILREKAGEEGVWNFVGDGYVHGWMDLDETMNKERGEDEIFKIY